MPAANSLPTSATVSAVTSATSATSSSSGSLPVPASAPRPRPTAGDYDLLRRIGSGAMGEVWLGKHRITGGMSAIKLLHPNVAARERAARFFARERRAIARLAHPHIVALHDLGDGYIATAYVDGADLSRRMQTPIEPRTAVRYILQIASALEHAHARGVIHRDVKPSNILVDRRGNAYLTDFGLAALNDDEGSQERAGTPAFMPPEQVRGEAGPEADQFALARTLATILAGVSVSAEGDPVGLLTTTPRPLVDVLTRATSPEPAERFPSMAVFANALAATELGDTEVPMRLAPESRVRTPFAWATGPRMVHAITHEIREADYRFTDLAKAGLLAPDAAAAFSENTGYEELAWSVYAHEGRLGPIASDGALARATDLVVILHGFLSCRRDWHDTAIAICRDNAQAVVLVPDLFGVGESRYLPQKQSASRATLEGTMASVVRWLDLLNVRDLPTVIVGHSFSGAALLGATDDQLGERVTRIVVTPGLFSSMTSGAIGMSKVMTRMAMVKALRPAMARMLRYTPDFVKLTHETCVRFQTEFLRAPSWLLAQAAYEQKNCRIAPADSLRHCVVLLSDDDHYYPAHSVGKYLEAHGIPREFIQLLVAGGHYPHLENTERPEAKAHNVEQITRCVDAMLTASHEGAPMSTMMASTVLGDSTG